MNDLHRLPSAAIDEEDGDTTLIRFTGGSLALTEVNAFVLTGLPRCITREVGPHRLVLDLGNVALVTAAGLGALVRLHKMTRAAGGSLALHNLNDEVYEVFEVTRLTSLFDVRRAAPEVGPRNPSNHVPGIEQR
jgi:anti-anti-sigma factor